MARRAAAFVLMIVVLFLAASLLWRVWRHHEDAGRYSDEPAVVHLDSLQGSAVKFAHTDR